MVNQIFCQVIIVVKCPDCLRKYTEQKKKWKYGKFDVEAYSCECGTDFRTYKQEGKHSFILKRNKKDKNWKKAQCPLIGCKSKSLKLLRECIAHYRCAGLGKHTNINVTFTKFLCDEISTNLFKDN